MSGNLDLKQVRITAGLTQVELAKRAAISRSTLSDLEKGKQSKPNNKTVHALADALLIGPEMCRNAIAVSVSNAAENTRMRQRVNEGKEAHALRNAGWQFLKDLDRDLASRLAQELIVQWTHNSTALEGNTLSIRETFDILTHGVTISGKSLIEHAEVHGHANAISLVAQVCQNGHVTPSILHDLHSCIQTGVSRDIFQPIGKWKVEHNGTMTKDGWHEYAAPQHVPTLMNSWFELYKQLFQALKHIKNKRQLRSTAVKTYAALHIAFTRIHPYADGNGRLARLLANVPLLVRGLPPLLIEAEQRNTYIQLLAENDKTLGSVKVGEALYTENKHFKEIVRFLHEAWKSSWELVDSYREKQKDRG